MIMTTSIGPFFISIIMFCLQDRDVAQVQQDGAPAERVSVRGRARRPLRRRIHARVLLQVTTYIFNVLIISI